MYSVLIVEDEYYVRSGIIRRIDWDKLGLQPAGEASNGLSALEFLQQTPVDILLTDIRMPEMNGLDLIAAAKQLYPHIRCIIISGYDDFTYTKSAIRMGVSDYIQKPIDEDELTETLQRIIHELEQEHGMAPATQPFNPHLTQQLAMQKAQRQLEYLLAGQQTDFECLPNEQYAVVTLYPGVSCEHSRIAKWLESLSLEGMRIFSSLDHETPMHIRILLCGPDLNERRLVQIATQLREALQNHIGSMSVRCGVSDPVHMQSSIASAYHQSMICLQSKMLYPDPVLSPTMLNPQNMDELNIAIHTIFELRDALSQRNKKNVQMLVSLLFSSPCRHIDTLRTILRYIADVVNEHIVRYHADAGDLIHILSDPNALLTFESMDELRTTIVPMILDFFFFNKHFLDDRIVGQVQLYIRQHLSEDLKVSTLGQVFFLSPNHLSFLFKKETGHTLSDYVENVRMERARVLLSMDYSIVEVASQIGYADASYFSRVFKKTTGMSPQKYQQEYKLTSN